MATTVKILTPSEKAMIMLRQYAAKNWGIPVSKVAHFEIAATRKVQAYVQFDVFGNGFGIEMREKTYRGSLYSSSETFKALHVVVVSEGREHAYSLRTSRLELVTEGMLDKAFASARRDGFKVG